MFDEMVDDVQKGEILIADFETDDPGGLTITVDYESLSITDDDIDIVLGGEILDTIHLFLEIRHAARNTEMNIDWDKLLEETPDQTSETKLDEN
jgi:hypothetical protein